MGNLVINDQWTLLQKEQFERREYGLSLCINGKLLKSIVKTTTKERQNILT
jgi:hypothetical protein